MRKKTSMSRIRRTRLICAAAVAFVITFAVVLIIALSVAKPEITLNCTEEQLEVFSSYTKAKVSASVKVLWFNFITDITVYDLTNAIRYK